MDSYLVMAASLGEVGALPDESISSFFYQGHNEVLIDRMLQQMARESGVELISLELEVVQSVLAMMPEAEMMDEESLSSQANQDASEIPGIVLWAQPVRLYIKGNPDSIMAMVDRIYDTNKSLVVTALDVIPGATVSNAGEMEGTLDVVYYYAEQ